MNQQQADHQIETKASSDAHHVQQQQEPHSSDYAPYPKIDPNDVAPPPQNWSNVSTATGPAPINESAATTMPAESNPYVSPAPIQPSSSKSMIQFFIILFIFNNKYRKSEIFAFKLSVFWDTIIR